VPPAKSHHPQNPPLPLPGIAKVPENATCQLAAPYAWAKGVNDRAATVTSNIGRIAMSFKFRKFFKILFSLGSRFQSAFNNTGILGLKL
jgi:hypothetical protein